MEASRFTIHAIHDSRFTILASTPLASRISESPRLCVELNRDREGRFDPGGCDFGGQDCEDGVDVGFGGLFAEGEADAADGAADGDAHRHEHVADGSQVEFEQALPELAAMPRASRPAHEHVALDAVERDVEVVRQAVSWQPLTCESGTAARMPSRSGRAGAGRAARVGRDACCRRRASAAAVPAMPATFSVPARFCISWPPPWRSDGTACARRR